MHPTRRLCMMLAYLFAALAVVTSVNWVANPYAIWPLKLIDKIYLQQVPGTERIKAPYRVSIDQPTTLLVGSSRILYGMPIEQGCRDGVYNAGLSGASLDEIVGLVRLARQGGRLQRVIWGVDFYPFKESYRGFRDGPTRARVEGDQGLLIRDTLLSGTAFEESLQLLYAAARGRQRLPPTALLPVPWPENVIRDTLQQLATGAPPDQRKFTRDLSDWIDLYIDYQLAQTQLDLVRDTVSQLQTAGIDVILLVPPLHAYELESIRQTGRWQAFQDWKRVLVGIAPYWDYSGYNQLSRTDWLYTPLCFCHFQPVVGNVILRQILGQDCSTCGDAARIILDAGVHVDASSVEEHLQEEEALLRANLASSSGYAQRISQVLPR